MAEERSAVETEDLDAEQKRRLRALRKAYRVSAVEVRDGGWELEVKYMDGSKISVDSKMLKIKSSDLSKSSND